MSSSSSSLWSQNEYDHSFKIILFGNNGVGKSSLLLRFIDNKYDDTSYVAGGGDPKNKVITVEGKKIKLQLWDIDATYQRAFRIDSDDQYRNTRGIVLLFDLTSKESFRDLCFNLLPEVIGHRGHSCHQGNNNMSIILVGTKSDLKQKRATPEKEITKFTQENKALIQGYIEVSAKENVNIDSLFELVVKEIMKINNARNSREVEQKSRSSSVDIPQKRNSEVTPLNPSLR